MCKYAIPKTTPNILYTRKESAKANDEPTHRLTNPNRTLRCPDPVYIASRLLPGFGHVLLM